MKLSFSTNGWSGYSWQDFLELASGMDFQGIELHKVDDGVLIGSDGPLNPRNLSANRRRMLDLGLELCCLDALCDVAGEDAEAAAAWLNRRGIETEPIREDRVNGGRFTFFKDPDGLPLEIHE